MEEDDEPFTEKENKPMLKKLFIIGAVCLTTALPPALAADGPARQGQWQITVKTEIPGMPMAMPPMTHTQCVSDENAIPQQAEPNQECQVLENKVEGNRLTWKMVCQDGETRAESAGSITYAGDTFAGAVETVITEPGETPMTVTNKMTGKRVGDCR